MKPMYYWINSPHTFEELQRQFKELNKKCLKIPETSQWLIKNTVLKNSYVLEEMGLYYVYGRGYYKDTGKIGYEKIIFDIVFTFKQNVLDRDVILIRKQLRLLKYYDPRILFKQDFVCFRNDLLDLNTGKFGLHTPDVFVTARLEMDYDLLADAPIWESFIEEFSGDPTQLKVIRSWLKLLIVRDNTSSTFLYILGKGGVGKSVFGNIASILSGEEDVLASSLKSLNNDRFELANLKDITLVYLTDNDNYQGDLGQLKKLTGGDLLQGRIKLKQGSYDLRREALVLIVSNFMLNSIDRSGALDRRIRLINVDNRSNKQKRLLYKRKRK